MGFSLCYNANFLISFFCLEVGAKRHIIFNYFFFVLHYFNNDVTIFYKLTKSKQQYTFDPSYEYTAYEYEHRYYNVEGDAFA